MKKSIYSIVMIILLVATIFSVTTTGSIQTEKVELEKMKNLENGKHNFLFAKMELNGEAVTDQDDGFWVWFPMMRLRDGSHLAPRIQMHENDYIEILSGTITIKLFNKPDVTLGPGDTLRWEFFSGVYKSADERPITITRMEGGMRFGYYEKNT